MAYYVSNTLLDDAYQHLNYALGLPNTTGGRKQLALLLRITAVFSWLAVEETVKLISDEFQAKGFSSSMPRRLMDQILTLLALRHLGTSRPTEADLARAVGQIRGSFDVDRFKRMRSIRNDIIHVNKPNTDPTTAEIADIKELFEYAKDIIGKLAGTSVLHQYQLATGKFYI